MAFSSRSYNLVLKNNFLQRFYSSEVKNIGFVGLGNMGSHMANNLIDKGYSLTVCDVNKDAVAAAKTKGAKSATSPEEIANSGAECIVTMLPNNKSVLDVYTSEGGILSKVKQGSLLIDSSTVDPQVAKSINEAASKKGVSFVDAPVSGGVNAAKGGSLTFMVGGKQNDFEKALPILQSMGSKITHCGEVGAGLTAKICNNMLLAISMIGTAECMNLGIRLGLDPKVLLSIVNSSSGRCWSSEVYNPVPGLMENVPASNNYNGGFASKLMSKDLGLASSVATESHTPIPLGSLSQQLYSAMVSKGYSDKDFSAIYDFLKQN